MLFSLRAGSRCDLCSPRLDGWLLLHLLLVDRMRIRLESSPFLTQYKTKSKRSRSARTQQKNWPHALSLSRLCEETQAPGPSAVGYSDPCDGRRKTSRHNIYIYI